jgi:hypothetical protein
MKLASLGEIVAERHLSLKIGDDGFGEVVILMGKPQRFPDSGDYFCAYQIKGVGNEKIRWGGGVDAFQAIEISMKMIGVDLDALVHGEGHKLSWNADKGGGLGFPNA